MKTDKQTKSKASNSKKPAAKKVQHKMSAPVTNHRLETCLWIVNLLHNNPRGLTRDEINAAYKLHLDRKYMLDPDLRSRFPDEIERRTFYNYCIGIAELLGVVVECDTKDEFRYKLVGGLDDKVTKWMMDSFATNEALLQTRDIRNRIVLEDVPSGNQHLNDIMQAIRENRKISFLYRNYGDASPKDVSGDPYCVKIYHQRWYVVVKEYLTDDESGKPVEEKHVYSLDRLHELKLSEETFKLEVGFNAEEFFYHAFAVRVEKDNPPRVIKIKIKNVQVPYIEDLKLHHSQKLQVRMEDYSIYTLYCALTVELVMQLLYYGSLVEVLEPNELRDEMMYQVYLMAKAYGVDQVHS